MSAKQQRMICHLDALSARIARARARFAIIASFSSRQNALRQPSFRHDLERMECTTLGNHYGQLLNLTTSSTLAKPSPDSTASTANTVHLSESRRAISQSEQLPLRSVRSAIVTDIEARHDPASAAKDLALVRCALALCDDGTAGARWRNEW